MNIKKLSTSDAFYLIREEYINQCTKIYNTYKESDPGRAGPYHTRIILIKAIDEDLPRLIEIVHKSFPVKFGELICTSLIAQNGTCI